MIGETRICRKPGRQE